MKINRRGFIEAGSGAIVVASCVDLRQPIEVNLHDVVAQLDESEQAIGDTVRVGQKKHFSPAAIYTGETVYPGDIITLSDGREYEVIAG